MFEVTVERTFPAAHALRNYHGRTEPVHGHNFRVEVTVTGPELDETGLLIDFIDLQRIVGAAVAQLDHRFLNETPPFDAVNPSAECIARHLLHEIGREYSKPVKVSRVRVWETPDASATYFAP